MKDHQSHLREFPFRQVPTGSGFRYLWHVNCRCGQSTTISHIKRLPDEVVNKKLRERGWSPGRNRSSDECPTCLGVKRSSILATKFKVIDAQTGESAVPAAEVVANIINDREEDNMTSEILTKLQELSDAIKSINKRLDDGQALTELLIETVQNIKFEPVTTPAPVEPAAPPRVMLSSVGNMKHYETSGNTYLSIDRSIFSAAIGSDKAEFFVDGDRIKIRKPGTGASQPRNVSISSKMASITTTIKGAHKFSLRSLEVQVNEDGIDLVRVRSRT